MIKKLKGHQYIGILQKDDTDNCMVTIINRKTKKTVLDISLDNLEVFEIAKELTNILNN